MGVELLWTELFFAWFCTDTASDEKNTTRTRQPLFGVRVGIGGATQPMSFLVCPPSGSLPWACWQLAVSGRARPVGLLRAAGPKSDPFCGLVLARQGGAGAKFELVARPELYPDAPQLATEPVPPALSK